MSTMATSYDLPEWCPKCGARLTPMLDKNECVVMVCPVCGWRSDKEDEGGSK